MRTLYDVHNLDFPTVNPLFCSRKTRLVFFTMATHQERVSQPLQVQPGTVILCIINPSAYRSIQTQLPRCSSRVLMLLCQMARCKESLAPYARLEQESLSP